MQNQEPKQVVHVNVVVGRKSVGLAILLALLFGPLGMLYATVWGGLIMFAVTLLVGALTLGFGFLLTWPVCVLWAALAAHNYNQRLVQIKGP